MNPLGLKRPRTRDIPFSSLGEYHLHYHWISAKGLGPRRLFNYAIRNREDLLRERIELHLNEELHSMTDGPLEIPLLRFDENGLWSWMSAQETWWPLRQQEVSIDLDRLGQPRVRYLKP